MWAIRLPPIKNLLFLRVVLGIQIATCVILAILAGLLPFPSSNTIFSSAGFQLNWIYSVDAPWWYVLQLPASIALLAVVKYMTNQARKAKFLLAYIVYDMLLGILSSIAFMIYTNELELAARGQRGCEATALPATSSTQAYNSELCSAFLARTNWAIGRMVAYICIQVICVHPAVSVIIELWTAKAAEE